MRPKKCRFFIFFAESPHATWNISLAKVFKKKLVSLLAFKSFTLLTLLTQLQGKNYVHAHLPQSSVISLSANSAESPTVDNLRKSACRSQSFESFNLGHFRCIPFSLNVSRVSFNCKPLKETNFWFVAWWKNSIGNSQIEPTSSWVTLQCALLDKNFKYERMVGRGMSLYCICHDDMPVIENGLFGLNYHMT